MFSGATSVNLDSKGRMAIPTRYRDALSEGMVCTIGLYHSCLSLYSISEWKSIEKQLSTLSTIVESERRIKRLLLGYAIECPMDNSGRILLPPTLRTYAKLEKHVMFVGQSNKFEIWDEVIWYQQISEDIAELSADITNLSDNLKNLTI
ncbi:MULTISPECIES: division/cell wall cluster transcriptional repressor MraZ [unclassified Gilliamella]|uniref:division/cell wall cluster transcriptional repressor MraZ n=1 Tax=unclassified Gilliamella TaxID=2685620 RepID=UPI002269C922|nr:MULTISPECIES: division/cell wall cluster transcriptional repressor MraZ [unclassified Gilliamella]MCX8642110.1 division/cell wall cluster transcriptional repressor MraZ [Gilliamella sp. B3835]MCX8707296.1 division/cell wall cluster transcriptional repressor MraZ [Gilliamella sp. B3783]MCX8710795.1 division/cell wall cluster transcriptional repressor MraZ [Gilliamella sp. B3780]MCX8711796.1 division/cell wall cluster transcriptional repressor MraZ [Gilliamella sp. B3468]MCX8713963.1 division